MRQSLILLSLSLLLACAAVPVPSPDYAAISRVHWEADTCRALTPPVSTVAALDPQRIRLLSWNIAKGRSGGWQRDLYRLSGDRDLVLLQEAVLAPAFAEALGAASNDFSPGYRTDRFTSGLWTASGATALSSCSFESREPWLTTPKMALVTEYPLKNTGETLMVANIHAVNFALGLDDFRAQLEQVAARLREHRGPLLFAGDFNTWSGDRRRLLDRIVDSLALRPVSFTEDRRRRAFGHPLDHVFYRGLAVVQADSRAVDSSDHNPLSATLRLPAAVQSASAGPAL